MGTLILLMALGAEPHVPVGVDSDKWLAAHNRRVSVEAVRLQRHRQLTAGKMYFGPSNYPWHLHPAVRSQQAIGWAQSVGVWQASQIQADNLWRVHNRYRYGCGY